MKKSFRYKNILFFPSLQFCGHIEEYFAIHSEKAVAYVVMPRIKNQYNLLRVYIKGKLVEEKKVWSSHNIFLYYLSWYLHYIYFIFKYFRSNESITVISGHPITFFGMTIQKLFRRITYAFWIGDYFPPVKTSLILFEKLKRYYHNRCDYNYYISDRINLKMNGRVINDERHKTVMWGVKSVHNQIKKPTKQFHLLFIGLLKGSQGIEFLLSILAKHNDIYLNLIGVGPDYITNKYLKLIKQYHIEKQVFFPNKFYNDQQLNILAQKCHAGIAFYDLNPLSATNYGDPGKVKHYIELGLPVVMTNISTTADIINEFQCGIVINQTKSDFETAVKEIRTNFKKYLKGNIKFCKFFAYESYYKKGFIGLESINY